MNRSLRNHVSRTTNAIESYHNILYSVIRENMPLSVSLCQILQLAKNDERDITNFYIEDCVPATTEEESDSRAPDFMEALTAEDDKRDNPRLLQEQI